jgi:hypothetical protein
MRQFNKPHVNDGETRLCTPSIQNKEQAEVKKGGKK